MSILTNAGFLDSVPIGAGMDWFSNTAPDNWMLCRGQAISRTDYAELFAIIGTTYGNGNGTTTFNLPDFRGRTGVGKSDSGTFAALNTQVGAETVTLTEAQMPRHSHGVTDPGHTHIQERVNVSGANDFDRTFNGFAITGVTEYRTNVTSATTGISIQMTGSGNAHTNIQPSIVQNKIIKVK